MNPIEAAVTPRKQEAIDNAVKQAQLYIVSLMDMMAKANWDLQAIAPRPKAFALNQREYTKAQQKRRALEMLLEAADPEAAKNRRFDDKTPEIMKASPERQAEFIESVKKEAAAAFDLYVGKLNAKIGAVVAATLSGGYIWSRSTLTITKADGTVERWLTQQIVNFSVYGKAFNQYPTRKVK